MTGCPSEGRGGRHYRINLNLPGSDSQASPSLSWSSLWMSPAPWLTQKSKQAWAWLCVLKSLQLRTSALQGHGPCAGVVAVAVAVAVGVLVLVPVAVAVDVSVGVPVAVPVAVAVPVLVAVPVDVAVAVLVGVGVIVGVEVDVPVTAPAIVAVAVGVSVLAVPFEGAMIAGSRVSTAGAKAP